MLHPLVAIRKALIVLPQQLSKDLVEPRPQDAACIGANHQKHLACQNCGSCHDTSLDALKRVAGFLSGHHLSSTFVLSNLLIDKKVGPDCRKVARSSSRCSCQLADASTSAASEGIWTAGYNTSGRTPFLARLLKVALNTPATISASNESTHGEVGTAFHRDIMTASWCKHHKQASLFPAKP